MTTQEALPGLDAYIAEDEQITPLEARTISETACETFEELILNPDDDTLMPLAEGYLDARARGFDWRKALYIAWARLPREARWPKTLGELASVMGLRSDRTIRKWRYNNPEIDKLVQKEMLTRVGANTADVLAALTKVATQANYKSTRAMELYLRVHGVYVPQQKIQEEVTAPLFYLPETKAEPNAPKNTPEEDPDVEA